MGWETALIIGGLQLASGVSQMKDANRQARAIAAEGDIVAANKAKEIRAKAAMQKVSFLNSGLTLDGTPMSVIEETFDTGLQDVNQIRSNYGARAKSAVSAGRSAMLKGFASAAGSYAMGAMLPKTGGVGALWDNGLNSQGWGFATSPVGTHGPFQ